MIASIALQRHAYRILRAKGDNRRSLVSDAIRKHVRPEVGVFVGRKSVIFDGGETRKLVWLPSPLVRIFEQLESGEAPVLPRFRVRDTHVRTEGRRVTMSSTTSRRRVSAEEAVLIRAAARARTREAVAPVDWPAIERFADEHYRPQFPKDNFTAALATALQTPGDTTFYIERIGTLQLRTGEVSARLKLKGHCLTAFFDEYITECIASLYEPRVPVKDEFHGETYYWHWQWVFAPTPKHEGWFRIKEDVN